MEYLIVTGNLYRHLRGFTLIELLVVMAIIGTLMSLVAPGYLQQQTRARETVLKHNLKLLRESLDDYRGDYGKNPETLDELVKLRYIKDIPLDPITGKRDSWVIVPLEQQFEGNGLTTTTNKDEMQIDIKSSAEGNGLDGSAYASW